jgi:hypothetical protein
MDGRFTIWLFARMFAAVALVMSLPEACARFNGRRVRLRGDSPAVTRRFGAGCSLVQPRYWTKATGRSNNIWHERVSRLLIRAGGMLEERN